MATNNSTTIPHQVKDLTGQRFGRLIVVEYAGIGKFRRAKWLCQCDCGNTHITTIQKERTRSCGCLLCESKTTHGQTDSPEYSSWRHMLERCLNPNHHAYVRYGGRGITVCDRWRASFEAFYEDMGTRPSLAYSIERIKNEEGYYPDNCKWGTPEEQARNRKGNRILHHDGQSRCLTVWAKLAGITPNALTKRLGAGWSMDRALTEPVHLRHTPAGSTESVKPS